MVLGDGHFWEYGRYHQLNSKLIAVGALTSGNTIIPFIACYRREEVLCEEPSRRPSFGMVS